MTDENMTDEKTTSSADANAADKLAEESSAQKTNHVIKIGSQRPGHEISVETKPAAPALGDSLEDDSKFAPKSLPGPSAPADEPVSGATIADSASTTATSDHTADIDTETVEHPSSAFPPPRVQRLSPEVQREVDEELEGISLDDLLVGGETTSEDSELEVDTRYQASVVKVDREYVFFTLPGHHEGAAPIRQFEELPEVGATLEVTVTGFKPDERLYELTIPGAAISVGDWSDLDEGVVVEVKVTGHNTGGLECEVNGIRGFIPISQIALYRVEDLAEFVDQKFPVVVTEVNPARRNLVVSRRALLEREQAEAREKLMQTLEVGQEHEGVVRNLRDFGAFVDIGGVDGLIHISKISWDRVSHPSEVLEVGQRVKVKIDKIDSESGKISFTYRDLLEQPWDGAETKYPNGSMVTGTVSKIMPFGAFVRIVAGVEGLVHISELAHHRVTRVDTVIQEGQEINVKVLSVDEGAQKMSLSLKAALGPPPADEKDAEDATPDEAESTRQPVRRSNKPLKGGLNKPTGGEDIGLRW